jgi:hypothetical protein
VEEEEAAGGSGPLLKSVQRSPLPFGDDGPRSQPRIVPLEVLAAASVTSQIGCEVVACEVIARRDGQGGGRDGLRLQGTARRPVNRFSE